MRAGSTCMGCLIKGQAERIRNESDDRKKEAYMRRILRLVADCPEGTTAPELSCRMHAIRAEYFGKTEFGSVKRRYNQMMLDRLPALRQAVRSAKDPLRSALCLSRAANYIDFSMAQGVDDDILERLMAEAEHSPLDETEYKNLHCELSQGRSLVYLADNCGEIVLDRLVLEVLRKQFPALNITLLVRGQEIVNDATMEDAEQCGLPDLVRVLGNGSPVAGTLLHGISKEARAAINGADLILSKGQGNFETLHGCGLNIYYLFLCKCDWFTTLFRVPRNTGMLLNERRVTAF